MNRNYSQFRYSLEKKVVDLYGRVTFGAAGAPTLDAVNSKGIKSIARTGAGEYDIVLGTGTKQDVYVRLLNFNVMNLNATMPASPQFYVISESVNTPSTGKITIQFAVGGVATDPGNGEEIRFQVSLKASSAQ